MCRAPAGIRSRRSRHSRVRPAPRRVWIVRPRGIRLVAAIGTGDLDMANQRVERLQPRRDVAMDQLAMIHVELQRAIRPAGLAHIGRRQVEVVEEIAGHVLAVDRLQQQLDAMLGKLVRGISQRGAIESSAPRDRWDRRAPPSCAASSRRSRAHRAAPCRREARNSSSRPTSEAMPRSPLAKSPGGRLNSACSSPPPASASPTCSGPDAHRETGTPPPRSRPPRRALKRSRKSHSVNIIERLAAKRGMAVLVKADRYRSPAS